MLFVYTWAKSRYERSKRGRLGMGARPSMTPEEFLVFARTCAMQRKIVLTLHIRRDSMPWRNVRFADLRQAVLTASFARFQPERGTWLILGGQDTDDDDLTVVAVPDGDNLRLCVVTTF